MFLHTSREEIRIEEIIKLSFNKEAKHSLNFSWQMAGKLKMSIERERNLNIAYKSWEIYSSKDSC